jgi:peptide/nickel transport system permease protein
MAFALKRLGLLVAVLLATSALAFGAMNLVGDPLVNLLGPIAAVEQTVDCDAVREAGGPDQDPNEIAAATGIDNTSVRQCQQVDEARERYHLDDPIPVRYINWLGDMASGDFGISFQNLTPVKTTIADRLPVTLLLVLFAQIISFGIAIPWAVTSAYRMNSVYDKASTVTAFGMLSVPTFAAAVLLLYFFTVKWQIFPTKYDDDDLLSRLNSLFLPAMALAIPIAATYQRLLRTDLITTLQEDFVNMARAKGLPGWFIMLRHALRPSMFSVVTVFGINTGALIGGTLVVESYFDVPGVGQELPQAVIRNDLPVVLAMVTIVAMVFVLLNFFVDLLYAYLDPRVRSE